MASVLYASLLLGVLAWLAVLLAGLWRYRRPLRALWNEPVFRVPILVLESDDWGAGPLDQAEALRRLISRLSAHRDADGRPAVMTLAIVLEVADTAAMAANGCREYRAKRLDDPIFGELLDVLRQGEAAGVFALQLHGQCHYWPANLLAARSRPEVQAWLGAPGHPATEALPSPLQSRWIDATVLPSRPLLLEEVAQAAAEEVATYAAIFGHTPGVVVPPTFIWNDTVERAWAEAGIRCVMTPGRRYEGRDANGRPQARGGSIVNGQHGAAGVRHLVRDIYFEPALGHRAEALLPRLEEQIAAGRPCLLETHRFNFLGVGREDALAETDRLLSLLRQAYPTLCFLPPAQILAAIERRDDRYLSLDLRSRLRVLHRRLRCDYPLWRWARLTGLAALSWGLSRLAAKD